MRIKLIQAPNMAEAMRRVRVELGEDALILGTRRVADGVEITAALEPVIADSYGPGTSRLAPGGPADVAIEPSARRQNSMARRAASLRFGTLDWKKPIMLVGGPGAGKTLTAAKLATRLVQMGDSPMIITTDGDRAGATEQLGAFTRILNLNLVVAENPLMLARTLANRPNGCKVIIDTAGLNPFDEDQCEMLVTHAVTADADLVWVLPAGIDADDAEDMAQAFATLGVRLMISTKLDMTRRFESLLRAAETGEFILTDAGIGSGVADGLIALESGYLVSRINQDTPYSDTRQAP
jgi:flagellar biosynthesis protein FlhF